MVVPASAWISPRGRSARADPSGALYSPGLAHGTMEKPGRVRAFFAYIMKEK